MVDRVVRSRVVRAVSAGQVHLARPDGRAKSGARIDKG
jgi:hypothetical protein